MLRELHEEFGLRLPPARLVWGAAFPALRDRHAVGWFFAGHLMRDEVASIRFGDEGQRWQMMPLDLWLTRPDAIAQLQARTARALKEMPR